MAQHPTRGLSFVRRLATADRIGSIYVPPAAATRATAQQAEIVAVGRPTLYDGDDPPEWVERQRETFRELSVGRKDGRIRRFLYRPNNQRLTPGTWVILRSHALLVTETTDVFAVRTSDIIAVVEES